MPDDWSCSECDERDKWVRGCTERSQLPHKLLSVEIVRTCPVRLGVDAHRYAEEYRYWQHHKYPNAGTHRDQPHKYLQAMIEIDDWIAMRNEQDGK